MLRRNKFILFLMSLVSALILSSCCEELPTGSSFGYNITILQNPESIVQSDKILADEITYNDEKRTFLYNVACSLRNDDSPETIIKEQVSERMYSGFLSFGFTTWKKGAEKSDNVYFEDESEFIKECDAQVAGTSKYFITINDPGLSGYDPKYETVKRYCHDKFDKVIYLGAAKESE